jgi:hypothetical protein
VEKPVSPAMVKAAEAWGQKKTGGAWRTTGL